MMAAVQADASFGRPSPNTSMIDCCPHGESCELRCGSAARKHQNIAAALNIVNTASIFRGAVLKTADLLLLLAATALWPPEPMTLGNKLGK
jgi:hypothetical protein